MDTNSKNINPLKVSETDERQSLTGGLFANEDQAARQDREKMQRAYQGYGQKMDGKMPGEPTGDHQGMDSTEEMEENG